MPYVEATCRTCGIQFQAHRSVKQLEQQGNPIFCSRSCRFPDTAFIHDYSGIPLGLCGCGCGQSTEIAKTSNRALGLIKGQPCRWVRGHSRRLSPIDYVEEDRGFETPCWIWQRFIDKDGYGIGTVDAKPGRAHRLMYEKHVGQIPHAVELHHRCEVRSCCNPTHMKQVTNLENIREAKTTRLTAIVVEDIRARYIDFASAEALAAHYGISANYVYEIATGRKRKHG